MPSGKKNIYSEPSKALYKVGTVKMERAAEANRDPARKIQAIKALAREGNTRGPQIIRTTVSMKTTPTKKR